MIFLNGFQYFKQQKKHVFFIPVGILLICIVIFSYNVSALENVASKNEITVESNTGRREEVSIGTDVIKPVKEAPLYLYTNEFQYSFPIDISTLFADYTNAIMEDNKERASSLLHDTEVFIALLLNDHFDFIQYSCIFLTAEEEGFIMAIAINSSSEITEEQQSLVKSLVCENLQGLLTNDIEIWTVFDN